MHGHPGPRSLYSAANCHRLKRRHRKNDEKSRQRVKRRQTVRVYIESTALASWTSDSKLLDGLLSSIHAGDHAAEQGHHQSSDQVQFANTAERSSFGQFLSANQRGAFAGLLAVTSRRCDSKSSKSSSDGKTDLKTWIPAAEAMPDTNIAAGTPIIPAMSQATKNFRG